MLIINLLSQTVFQVKAQCPSLSLDFLYCTLGQAIRRALSLRDRFSKWFLLPIKHKTINRPTNLRLKRWFTVATNDEPLVSRLHKFTLKPLVVIDRTAFLLKTVSEEPSIRRASTTENGVALASTTAAIILPVIFIIIGIDLYLQITIGHFSGSHEAIVNSKDRQAFGFRACSIRIHPASSCYTASAPRAIRLVKKLMTLSLSL